MWERFSYYGMRALLVLFLTSSILDGGYGWERDNALQLYAMYTGLVYFTPLFGGLLADKVLGYRKAVIIGAFVMAFGHLCMALEIPTFFYIGLLALILGNGLFKPNISSIVGQLYTDQSKKDGAYTIFYMGINAGAFLGILLCGYIGEKIGWSYGFGLAMIFMIVGAIQFWLGGKILGDIGLAPQNDTHADLKTDIEQTQLNSKSNSGRLYMWLGISAVIGLVIYFVNPLKEFGSLLTTVNSAYMPSIIIAAFIGIIGFIVSDPSLGKIEKDRVWVIVILTMFTVFFWWAFEQAGGSMTIFARDYTDRSLVGSQATTFKVFNTLLTIVPMIVITWVLFKLFRTTYDLIPTSNIVLGLSFVLIWAIVCLLYTSPSPRDRTRSRMPSSA